MTNALKNLAASAARLVAVGLCLAGTSSTAQVTIVTPETTGSFDVMAHNDHQFATGFGFSIETDTSTFDESQLLEHLNALSLTTAGGAAVQSFAILEALQLAVGTSVPDSSVGVSAVEVSEATTSVIIGVRKKSGEFVRVEEADVGVFRVGGDYIGFELENFEDSDALAFFDILVDRSGSMGSVMGKVRDEVAAFMRSLPSNARCRVTSFNQHHTRHTDRFLPCASAEHRINEIEAGGGTNIYEPLLLAYRSLSGIRNQIKVVVVISDGVGRSDITKDRIAAAKSAATFVFWRGVWVQEERLEGIVDTSIYGGWDSEKHLSKFLEQIKLSVHGQVVITVRN